jgi:hypothetical protein
MTEILTQSKSGTRDVIIYGGYKDFGFDNPTSFYRNRSILIDKQFIIYDNNSYFVNPCLINYYNRRQWHTLKILAGMIKDKSALNFGVIPPPPKKK